MRILNLIENTEGTPGCQCEHGLSFYIETGGHRILADTGASGPFSLTRKSWASTWARWTP